MQKYDLSWKFNSMKLSGIQVPALLLCMLQVCLLCARSGDIPQQYAGHEANSEGEEEAMPLLFKGMN